MGCAASVTRTLLGIGLCALVGYGVFPTLSASASGVRSATPAGAPVGTFTGCPTHVRPLPRHAASYEATVERIALRFVRTGFLRYAQTPAANLLGARVRRVLPVRDWGPSGWIKTECGLRVWERSVTVLVYFPRLDKPHNPVGHCNAYAQLTFLLARADSGWSVWGRY